MVKKENYYLVYFYLGGGGDFSFVTVLFANLILNGRRVEKQSERLQFPIRTKALLSVFTCFRI